MTNDNFMLAIRERRAKMLEERNTRITVMAITFTIGILVGMLFQSVLSKYLDPKAAAAVEQLRAASE